ncbi:hypothetical protein NDU88_006820 [Pleurodeles waltl]|uniref:Uncharacterized protein n=1 Tax=Pleurodeles waltl TaxID=8319 RepID=A0AAV7SQW5_PLEWA|nr:hypothetical protein NDU88_006820 [Pleurodeles waltl]
MLLASPDAAYIDIPNCDVQLYGPSENATTMMRSFTIPAGHAILHTARFWLVRNITNLCACSLTSWRNLGKTKKLWDHPKTAKLQGELVTSLREDKSTRRCGVWVEAIGACRQICDD